MVVSHFACPCLWQAQVRFAEGVMFFVQDRELLSKMFARKKTFDRRVRDTRRFSFHLIMMKAFVLFCNLLKVCTFN